MHRAIKALALPLAIMLCLCSVLSPVQAADTSFGYVHLMDDGADGAGNTTDWQFDVPLRTYLYLDDENWNLTVTASLINGTGAAAAGTYIITMYINDGTANVSASVSIVTNMTAEVEGVLSFDSTEIAALSENDSAAVYVTLTHSSIVVDRYSSTVQLTDDMALGMSTLLIALMLGPVLTLMFIGAMFGWMGDLIKGLSGMFGGAGFGKSRK